MDGWTYGFDWDFRSVATGYEGNWCDTTNHEEVSPYNGRAFWSDGFANPLDTSELSQLVGLVVCSGADQPKA